MLSAISPEKFLSVCPRSFRCPLRPFRSIRRRGRSWRSGTASCSRPGSSLTAKPSATAGPRSENSVTRSKRTFLPAGHSCVTMPFARGCVSAPVTGWAAYTAIPWMNLPAGSVRQLLQPASVQPQRKDFPSGSKSEEPITIQNDRSSLNSGHVRRMAHDSVGQGVGVGRSFHPERR